MWARGHGGSEWPPSCTAMWLQCNYFLQEGKNSKDLKKGRNETRPNQSQAAMMEPLACARPCQVWKAEEKKTNRVILCCSQIQGGRPTEATDLRGFNLSPGSSVKVSWRGEGHCSVTTSVPPWLPSSVTRVGQLMSGERNSVTNSVSYGSKRQWVPMES